MVGVGKKKEKTEAGFSFSSGHNESWGVCMGMMKKVVGAKNKTDLYLKSYKSTQVINYWYWIFDPQEIVEEGVTLCLFVISSAVLCSAPPTPPLF